MLDIGLDLGRVAPGPHAGLGVVGAPLCEFCIAGEAVIPRHERTVSPVHDRGKVGDIQKSGEELGGERPAPQAAHWNLVSARHARDVGAVQRLVLFCLGNSDDAQLMCLHQMRRGASRVGVVLSLDEREPVQGAVVISEELLDEKEENGLAVVAARPQ